MFIDMREVLKQSPQFKNEDTMTFCEKLLVEHFVAVVPGEAFHCPGFFVGAMLHLKKHW